MIRMLSNSTRPEEEEKSGLHKRKRDEKEESESPMIAPTIEVQFVNLATSDLVKMFTTEHRYQCPICHNFVWQPMGPPCEHYICKNCCQAYYRESFDDTHNSHASSTTTTTTFIKKDRKCPSGACGKNYRMSDYVPMMERSPSMGTALNQLVIFCPCSESRDMGCKWTGFYSQGVAHYVSKCEHRRSRCKACNQWFHHSFIAMHVRTCKIQLICSLCEMEYVSDSNEFDDRSQALRFHSQLCPRSMVRCQYYPKCTISIERQHLTYHIENECDHHAKYHCPIPSCPEAVKVEPLKPSISTVISSASSPSLLSMPVTTRYTRQELLNHLRETEWINFHRPIEPWYTTVVEAKRSELQAHEKLVQLYRLSERSVIVFCSQRHLMHVCSNLEYQLSNDQRTRCFPQASMIKKPIRCTRCFKSCLKKHISAIFHCLECHEYRCGTCAINRKLTSPPRSLHTKSPSPVTQ